MPTHVKMSIEHGMQELFLKYNGLLRNDGMMELRNDGMMELRNDGMMELRNDRITELRTRVKLRCGAIKKIQLSHYFIRTGH